MNHLHVVRFPRWQDVESCRRTVMHVPVRSLPHPPYRLHDTIIGVNNEDFRQAVVLRITELRVGPLPVFIGRVGSKGTNDELQAVGLNWEEYKKSWKKTYGTSPESEESVLRMELGYEPAADVKELLERYVTGASVVECVLEAAKKEVMKQEDAEFLVHINGLKNVERGSAPQHYKRYKKRRKTEENDHEH